MSAHDVFFVQSPSGEGSVRAQQTFQCCFQLASRVVVACLGGHGDSCAIRFFRIVLSSQLLIKLTELVISRDVFRVRVSYGLELPQRFVILSKFHVFQRECISREGIVWIVLKKAF